MKRFLTLLFVLLFSAVSFSQKKPKKVLNDVNFKPDSLPFVILKELNRFRISNGLDTLQMSEMLQFSADISAEQMSYLGKDKMEPKQTRRNLKKAGATKRGEEITMKASLSKGKELFKTADIAKIIYNRWESNAKNLVVLNNPKYTLAGISCMVDEEGKKVYVSAVFGGYDITNGGVIYKEQLAVPFNTKSKKLKSPDLRTCKTCEKWRNYDLLVKGLYVSGDKIFLKYQNAKDLRRFLKKSKDGIVVDVVQRSQYINADYNIVDNNLFNKGVMSKVVYRDRFFKKNLLAQDKKTKSKIKAIEVEVGKFNTEITGPYEINLIIVQDGKVCKTITRGYTETGLIESNTPIGIMPTPKSTGLKPPFEPRSESSLINITIPFEKSKSEFKQEDIQPFIQTLNEPDFIIDGLYIYAYASIEGDSVTNAKLQRKRAESVVKVLQGFQKNKISPTIQTKDSWDLFMLENEDGKYADLVSLGKKKAIAKINSDKSLEKELEPILAKERFAQIVMDITYDVSGDKEQKFSRVSFNRSVTKANNQPQSYKIMEFINKRVQEGKYPQEIYDSLKIEENTVNIGLINNRIYYKYLASNTVDEGDEATYDRLLKLNASNPVLQYNKVFCNLKLDNNAGNAEHQAQVQGTIDGLYGKLDSNYVNGLNIEWQFKIMESLDTMENAGPQIDACIARIKSFYKIKDASWQNGLKLSYVFSRAKDYTYSATILEPYLNMPNVPENLVFMYISSASRVQEKYYSRTFARALEIAKDKNKDRYCKLFGEPFMTFQVLENPEVKKVYQGSCQN